MAQVIREVPYTNGHNETINPGDRVITLTTSAGQPSVNTGVYLGLNSKGGAVVRTERTRRVFRHKVTGEEYDFDAEYKEIPYMNHHPYYSPEYRAVQEERTRLREIRREPYAFVEEPYEKVQHLQRNWIRPAGFAL